MQEFSNQLKEAGESKEESILTISLAISILAVLVALVTVLGHHVGGEAVLAQSRADDTWNQYQAKRIRSDQASVAVDLLSLQPSANAVAVQAKIAEYQAHLEKWKGDLTTTEEHARELEAEVTHSELQANRLEIGEALPADCGGAVLDYAVYAAEAVFLFGCWAGCAGAGGGGDGAAGALRSSGLTQRGRDRSRPFVLRFGEVFSWRLRRGRP